MFLSYSVNASAYFYIIQNVTGIFLYRYGYTLLILYSNSLLFFSAYITSNFKVIFT